MANCKTSLHCLYQPVDKCQFGGSIQPYSNRGPQVNRDAMTQEVFPEIQAATQALEKQIAVTETEIDQMKKPSPAKSNSCADGRRLSPPLIPNPLARRRRQRRVNKMLRESWAVVRPTPPFTGQSIRSQLFPGPLPSRQELLPEDRRGVEQFQSE